MLIISLFGFIILVGVVLVFTVLNKPTPAPANVRLTIWGVWDETSDLQSLIRGYNRLHPYITISYEKIRYEEYEDRLVKGWAIGNGPDIYAIPASWITQYKENFIFPLPKTTSVSYYTTEKILFKTETKIETKKETSLTATNIDRDYIDVVYNDIVRDGKIYGLPLGMNTLAMYYNTDLLNQSSVVQPPKTWNEFNNIVKKITLVDENDQIIRAGAALGTYDNIPNASDIVTTLMMQNGAEMTNEKGIIGFTAASPTDPTYFPAIQALNFYTDFANSGKSVYTWNKTMPNAIDEFASGKLAFLFAYPYQEAEIIAKSQGLNYEVTAIPQINVNNKVNYANYWVYTVSGNSSAVNFAWNFLQYASAAKNVPNYLDSTKQASVLKSVINTQLADLDRGVIAEQALTAQSWYRGNNAQQAEEHFSDMINSIVNETLTVQEALNLAAIKIGREY